MARIPTVIFRSLMITLAFHAQNAYAQDAAALPDIHKNQCHIPYTSPAVIETVTQQILVEAEKHKIDPNTGKTIVLSPAIYRTETVQKIVRKRQTGKIQVICITDYTTDFIQSLQRALAARKLYDGKITGIMDDRTKRTVRKVQKELGANTSHITVDLAESYGLIAHRIFEQ